MMSGSLKLAAVLSVCLALCIVGSALAEREDIDKIAVIVGDEVILASELAGQIQLYAFQTGRRPQTEEEIEQFQNEVLQQMISDRLFLMKAKEDTSIVVRREEIQQALDEQVTRVAANFNSHEEFLQALAQEGLTLRDLERRYYGEIENSLLRQRYIQKRLYNVSVSRYEVEQFFEEFEDSIPNQPEALKLAHILLKVQPSVEVEDSVKALATDLRQRILDGADFAAISSEFSSYSAGDNGGDLGYVKRGDVVPEFARAAFKLAVGDISGVIRTEFGYHVIKAEGKRGDRLWLRHLLLGVQPSAEDTLRVTAVADSLLREIRGGADFAELAKAFSADDDTRAQGGELGWFALNEFPQEFASAVIDWKTPGEVRGAVNTRFGMHLLKLLDYQPEKELTLENDFDQIKELARQDKTGRLVDEWITELKQKTFVEYRLEGSN
jgi:peptidyl-prolyl cis-trans isomerase SurA